MFTKLSTRTLCLLGLLSVSSASLAQQSQGYQFEIPLTYTDFSGDGDIEAQSIEGGVIAYLAPVQYGNYPYAIASFLDRKPYIGFFAGKDEISILSQSLNGKHLSATVGYGDPSIPLAISINFEQTKPSGKIDGVNFQMSATFKQAILSYYLNSHSALSVGYKKMDIQLKADEYSSTNSSNAKLLTYKNSIELSESRTLLVEGGVELIKSTDSSGEQKAGKVSLMLDYFPERSFGFGGEIAAERSSKASEDGRTYSVHVNKFLAQKIELDLRFEHFSGELNDNDSQNVVIKLGMRI